MQTNIFKCFWMGFWALLLAHGFAYRVTTEMLPLEAHAPHETVYALDQAAHPICHALSTYNYWSEVDACEDVDFELESSAIPTAQLWTRCASETAHMSGAYRCSERTKMGDQRPFYLMYAQWKWHLLTA